MGRCVALTTPEREKTSTQSCIVSFTGLNVNQPPLRGTEMSFTGYPLHRVMWGKTLIQTDSRLIHDHWIDSRGMIRSPVGAENESDLILFLCKPLSGPQHRSRTLLQPVVSHDDSRSLVVVTPCTCHTVQCILGM